MKHIQHYDEYELGSTSMVFPSALNVRRASRVMMLNENGEVAVMHFTRTGLHKLPGGGIEQDESPEQAAHREVKEETGCTIKNLTPVGYYTEARHTHTLYQISYLFVAELDTIGTAKPMPDEAEAGMTLVWFASPDAALTAIRSQKIVDSSEDTSGFEMMKHREVVLLEYIKKEEYGETC